MKGSKIKKFREDINQANALVVEKKTFQYNSDNKSKKFRRSIFACQNIKKGELFTRNNIKKVRPGQGLHPKYYNLIINKKSLRSIKKNEPLKIQHYKKI